MHEIPDKSIDFILCDLPYGTTNCKWDSTIPLNDFLIVESLKNKTLYQDEWMLHCFRGGVSFESAADTWSKSHQKGLWSHYERVIKDRGAILLFAQTPFDKVLGESNTKLLRYEWIWEKTQATGHLNAKKMPMKAHENVLVFYKNLPTYNPQKTSGHKPMNSYTKYIKTQNNTEIYGKMSKEISGGGDTDRYPRSVQVYSSDKQTSKLHSTQKPLKLCEFFVSTYTNEGDLVLDNTAGSGTTGLACKNLNRNYIMIEKDEFIFLDCKKRVGEN